MDCAGAMQALAATGAELRNALARCPDTAQAFGSGEQCDAAEALDCLLRCLDEALLPANASQAGASQSTLLTFLCGQALDEVS